MNLRAGLMVLVVLHTTGCTKNVLLRETEPLLITARAPAPPPPPPARVEVKKEKIQVNEKIHFEFDSDKIKPESFDLLSEIASVINKHPELKKIRVEGHTDNVGSRTYNLNLSKRRAKSVRDHLVSKGQVDAARFEMDGYGFDKPIDTNDSEEGRAKNRRVEFMILQRAGEKAAESPAKKGGPKADASGTKTADTAAKKTEGGKP